MHAAVAKQKRPHPYTRTESESVHPTRTPTLDHSSSIISLQRTAGNRAVGQFLQAKLAVSAPGDQYEQEADRVAEEVTQYPPQSLSGNMKQASAPPLVQRRVSGSAAGISQAPPSVHDALSSPGQPLPADVQEEMGQRFGHDFSNVRLHSGSVAEQPAEELHAKAYTVGQDIVLGAGHSLSESGEGLRLMAHELAHVVQQTGGGTTQRTLTRGEPAAVQRDSTLKITKKLSDMSRAEVQQALQEFFEKTMKAQGGKSVRMTEDVKNTIRRILLNDMPALMKLDSYLGSSIFPGSPAELAAAVAAYLPDPLEASRLAHLGASSGPGPTKMERVGDLVKKTEPFESPDTLEQKWKFDREATQLRKGEGAVGPFGVDLNRIFNVWKGLPGALKSPPSQTKAVEARSYPQVNAVIDKISKTVLVPTEAKGTSNADNFADAQLVAQDLARQLDIAYQRKHDRITLQLTPNYNGVKDRADMIREVIKLVQLIRDALPHQASGVSTVDLYFGDRLVQRIPLAAKAE